MNKTERDGIARQAGYRYCSYQRRHGVVDRVAAEAWSKTHGKRSGLFMAGYDEYLSEEREKLNNNNQRG